MCIPNKSEMREICMWTMYYTVYISIVLDLIYNIFVIYIYNLINIIHSY